MELSKQRGKLVIDGSLWFGLLVYLLMFISNDTYLFGTNAVYRITTIPWYIMAAFIVFAGSRYIINGLEDDRQQRILIFGMIMSLIFVALAIYHNEYLPVALSRLLCILSAMLFTMRYGFEDYKEAFTRVMVFNAVTALLFEMIAYILPGFVKTLPRMMNTAGIQYISTGLAGIDIRGFNSRLIRASSIFWEPGVFQMYLNLALIMELFTRKEIRVRYVVILCVGVLTTLSTTGYIVLMWVLATYFLLGKKNEISIKHIFALIVLLAIVLIFVNNIDLSMISEKVFGKLTDEDSGSTVARKASVYVNIQMALDHPLTGFGIKYNDAEMAQRSLLLFGHQTTHNTNTLLYQFGAYGLVYGALFVVGTFGFTKCLSKKKLIRAVLFFGIVLIYVGENLRTSMLPYLLVFYGYGAQKPSMEGITNASNPTKKESRLYKSGQFRKYRDYCSRDIKTGAEKRF